MRNQRSRLALHAEPRILRTAWRFELGMKNYWPAAIKLCRDVTYLSGARFIAYSFMYNSIASQLVHQDGYWLVRI
jgi:hypothetical protein